MAPIDTIDDSLTLKVGRNYFRFPGNEGKLMTALLEGREAGCHYISREELETAVWGGALPRGDPSLAQLLHRVRTRAGPHVVTGHFTTPKDRWSLATGLRIERTDRVIPAPPPGKQPLPTSLILRVDGKRYDLRGREASVLRLMSEDWSRFRTPNELCMSMGLEPNVRLPMDKAVYSLRKQIPGIFENVRGRGWRVHPERRIKVSWDIERLPWLALSPPNQTL